MYLDNYVGSAEQSRLMSRDNQELLGGPQEPTGWCRSRGDVAFQAASHLNERRLTPEVALEKTALPVQSLESSVVLQ